MAVIQTWRGSEFSAVVIDSEGFSLDSEVLFYTDSHWELQHALKPLVITRARSSSGHNHNLRRNYQQWPRNDDAADVSLEMDSRHQSYSYSSLLIRLRSLAIYCVAAESAVIFIHKETTSFDIHSTASC